MSNVPLVAMKKGISVFLVALQVHGQVETILYVEASPTKPCNAMIPFINVALVSCEEILQYSYWIQAHHGLNTKVLQYPVAVQLHFHE